MILILFLVWAVFTALLGFLGSLFIDPAWLSYVIAGIVVAGLGFGIDLSDVYWDL